MSTMPSQRTVPASPDAAGSLDRAERRARARAAVTRRLHLATDALAAADLLLGVFASTSSVGTAPRGGKP